MNDSNSRLAKCRKCRGVMMWGQDDYSGHWVCRSCGGVSGIYGPLKDLAYTILLIACVLVTMSFGRGCRN